MGSFESLQNTTSFTLQRHRLITPSRCVGEPVGASWPATQMFLSWLADIFCSMHHSKCGAGDICRPRDLLHCSVWPVMSWAHGSSPCPFTLIPPPFFSALHWFRSFSQWWPIKPLPDCFACFITIVSNAVYLISHYFHSSLRGIRIECWDASRIRSDHILPGSSSRARPHGRRMFNGTNCNNSSVIVLHCSSITKALGSIRNSGVFL